MLRTLAIELQDDLALHAVNHRYAVWIDMTDSLYPPAAAALGVPLDRLLLIKLSELHQALQVVEIVLRGGAAQTIVLDVPKQTPPMRLGTYHRLRHRVRDSRCSVCILTPQSIVPTPHRVVLDMAMTQQKRLEVG